MSWLRGWMWTAVAVAGTATAATLAYRYVTRETREPEGQAGAEAQRAEAEAEASASELEDEEEAEEAEQQQRLALVSREGNMLLSVFGLVFLLLVVAVSVVVSWSGDQAVPLTELPMFTPLVWIAIGIFTAATVEVLNPSSASPAGIPDKVIDSFEK